MYTARSYGKQLHVDWAVDVVNERCVVAARAEPEVRPTNILVPPTYAIGKVSNALFGTAPVSARMHILSYYSIT